MVSILKDHTVILQEVTGEVTNISAAVRKLLNTADDNRKIIQAVEDKVIANKDEITKIRQTLADYRKEFDEIQQQISVIPDMRDHIHVSIFKCIYVSMFTQQ